MNPIIQTSTSSHTSLRTASIVAGVGLLLMAILAPIANFVVLEKLLVQNDAAATVQNISASESLFRIGIVCFLVVVVLDVLVAWALYVLLKPVNQHLSMLAGWFRLVYSAIFGVALADLLNVLPLISNATYATNLDPELVNAQVMLSLHSFRNIWDIGLVIFSIHLLLLGYLSYVSGYVPKYLGVLLVAAFFGYALDGIGKMLSSDYTVTISMFTFVGEVVLIFWLLIKGVRLNNK